MSPIAAQDLPRTREHAQQVAILINPESRSIIFRSLRQYFFHAFLDYNPKTIKSFTDSNRLHTPNGASNVPLGEFTFRDMLFPEALLGARPCCSPLHGSESKVRRSPLEVLDGEGRLVLTCAKQVHTFRNRASNALS